MSNRLTRRLDALEAGGLNATAKANAAHVYDTTGALPENSVLRNWLLKKVMARAEFLAMVRESVVVLIEADQVAGIDDDGTLRLHEGKTLAVAPDDVASLRAAVERGDDLELVEEPPTDE